VHARTPFQVEDLIALDRAARAVTREAFMRGIMRVAVVVTLFAAGCATSVPPLRPPTTDVSGQWAGVWSGYGINNIQRQEPASAQLIQQGMSGHGRLTLENTSAAESIPRSLRLPGLTGAPVRVTVSGNDVTLAHELDDRNFTVNMTASGDRMTGVVQDTHPPVQLVLERVKPPAPPAPKAMAPPPPPAPAPAPPAVVAPPPPASAPPVAMPAPAERPAPGTFSSMTDLRPVYFDFDRSDIRTSDAQTLDGNAQWLQSNRTAQVIVEGHADERGTSEYNIALGERRARAVRDYLISRGVEAGRITVLSYGEDRPACTLHTEACWTQNRRVEFRGKAQ
jgi:peptidoglycan-associated lipoprotein